MPDRPPVIIGLCSDCHAPANVLHHLDRWETRYVVVKERSQSNPHEVVERDRKVNERHRRSYCRECLEAARNPVPANVTGRV